MIRRPTDIVKTLLEDIVSPGDTVVDATCGNGNDTLILATLVGSSGRVIAIDTQMRAIDATREKLASSTGFQTVELIQDSHDNLTEIVEGASSIRVIVFNLGYLPGGDTGSVTQPESTTSAIGKALDLIDVDGAVLVTIYPGHVGGSEEAHQVDILVSNLDPKRFSVARYQWINQSSTHPYVLIFHRRS